MPIRWAPIGALDISTDPQELPTQMMGKVEVSGAMTRCTNLRLDRKGVAETRYGSRKINWSLAPDGPIWHLLQHGVDLYTFAGTKIYQDWTGIASGLTSAPWFSVVTSPWNALTQSIFALNGTDRKVIQDATVREWGIAPPVAAPTVSKFFDWVYCYDWEPAQVTATRIAQFGLQVGDVPNYRATNPWEVQQIAGDESVFANPYTLPNNAWWFEYFASRTTKFQVVYTYCRVVDGVLECESNPSPIAETQIESGLWVEWAIPTDTQITHVRIYRSLASWDPDTVEAIHYYDSQHAVALGEVALIKRDEELGTAVARDHDRPPLGTQVLGPSFDGVLFIIKDNLLYYSKPNQPEYWPALNYVEASPVQFPIQAGAFIGGQLFIASKIEIYQVQGTGSQSFFPLPIASLAGEQSPHCFCPLKGFGIYHLGRDGLYLFTIGSDSLTTDANFFPTFHDQTINNIPQVNRLYLDNCWILPFRGKLFFGYPGDDSEFPDNFLVMDLDTKRSMHFQFPVQFRALTIDKVNERLLAGDADGYEWELECPDWTTDEGTVIAWQVETKEFGGLRKYFPRYARYDVALTDGATAAGDILLDGVSKQNHPLLTSRQTRKRLVDGCTGDRLAVRISGTGPVEIYGVEVE